jgi:hypothetical protein
MKIKHSIKLEDEDMKPLFEMVKVACLQTYPSTVAQEAALVQVEAEFRENLQNLLSSAFSYGMKIGKHKADMKDTEMYKPE